MKNEQLSIPFPPFPSPTPDLRGVRGPSAPTLSIIVPTIGRGPINQLFHSILSQDLSIGDEVIIVGDGHVPDMEDMVKSLKTISPLAKFRYVQGPETHDWGHSQINFALPLATASHVMVQDDDDIYVPRAFHHIRKQLMANPTSPHLFRFYTFGNRLVWNDNDGRKIERALVGGHNLIIPNPSSNDPDRHAKLGAGGWTSDYCGDLSWIKSVLSNYPERKWVWRKEIIVRQRPDFRLYDYPVISPSEETTKTRLLALRKLRNECRLFMTSFQHEITEEEQLGAFRAHLSTTGSWAFIFTDSQSIDNTPIGFNYVKIGSDNNHYITFGLTEKARGKGFGSIILQHAIDATATDLYSEILSSNTPSFSLHRTLGFHETHRSDSSLGQIIHLKREYEK